MLMFSENLELAQINVDIIIEIFENDLILHRVLLLNHSFKLFIYFSLDLISKSNEKWRRIHHLSYSSNHSVNDFISKSRKLKYTTFQETLDMIIEQELYCIIVKETFEMFFETFSSLLNVSDYWVFIEKKNIIKKNVCHLISHYFLFFLIFSSKSFTKWSCFISINSIWDINWTTLSMYFRFEMILISSLLIY
jgi:hypothetical protein